MVFCSKTPFSNLEYFNVETKIQSLFLLHHHRTSAHHKVVCILSNVSVILSRWTSFTTCRAKRFPTTQTGRPSHWTWMSRRTETTTTCCCLYAPGGQQHESGERSAKTGILGPPSSAPLQVKGRSGDTPYRDGHTGCGHAQWFQSLSWSCCTNGSYPKGGDTAWESEPVPRLSEWFIIVTVRQTRTSRFVRTRDEYTDQ